MITYPYDNELDQVLINSFEPYASIVKDNKETEEECAEVLARPFINYNPYEEAESAMWEANL
jgi:hypothetical protein